MSLVSIVMGSKSDLPVMQNACEMLKEFGVSYEVRVLSAHRTPVEAHEYASTLIERGVKVVIAAAGGAAHLAGVVAGNTTLPVIGVPIQTSALGGMDSLLSTVQMPKGIPVATVAIGKAGAANAAILATQILAVSDAKLAEKMVEYKKSMAAKIMEDTYIETYEGE